MNDKLQAYLQRINYTGSTEPTIENLTAIHRAHMMTVPFENLDIHVGRWIVLDEEKLFRKIVNERRGGFCFEQNGLFYAMLHLMDFDVIRIEANVYKGDGQYSIPMDHMALIVKLDGKRWVADVGFGDSFIEPLELDNPSPQTIGENTYKFEIDGDTGYYSAQGDDGNWQIQYRFFYTPHELEDYADACYYMQTSPETHFTQKRICSKPTAEGRISLSDLRLIQRVNGVRTERNLADETEFDQVLMEQFQIDLSPARLTADRTDTMMN